MLAPYAVTAAVANGSAVVNCAGAALLVNAYPGDTFHHPNGTSWPIAAVNSNTQITLALPFAGADATVTGCITRRSDAWASTAQVNLKHSQLLEAFRRGYTLTSATNLAISAGAKAFVTEQGGLPLLDGVRLRATSRANPTTHWMDGICSVAGDTITMTVIAGEFAGAGSRADWNINLVGARGPIGAAVEVPGATGVNNLALWDALNGGKLKDGGSFDAAFDALFGGRLDAAFTPKFNAALLASNPVRDFAVNLFADSGRFAGNAVATEVVSTFTFPNYISLYNGASAASEGKFIANNNDYGGAGGALPANIKSLIDKVKDASYRRYGVEFFAARITAGSGTATSTVYSGTTYYYSAFLTFGPRPPKMTFRVHIRAIDAPILFNGYAGLTVYKDGVEQGAQFLIAPADGWVTLLCFDSLSPRTSVDYNPMPLRIYCSTSGHKYLLACPALMGGLTNVDNNTLVVPGVNRWLV